jgi:hypothetical protein
MSSVSSNKRERENLDESKGKEGKASDNDGPAKTKKKKTSDIKPSTRAVVSGITDTSNSEADSKDITAIPKFKPLTLTEIRNRILKLSKRVPSIPPGGLSPDNKDEVKKWAAQMQTIIEEFNLSMCCVASATYKWGSDRSGAADQSLTLLSAELGNAQDQISSSLSPRLSNVLSPAVELVTSKVTIKKNKETEEEIRTNLYTYEMVDPAYVEHSHQVLCRNAHMLRHVILTNFEKISRCIVDYIEASTKDSQTHRNSLAY